MKLCVFADWRTTYAQDIGVRRLAFASTAGTAEILRGQSLAGTLLLLR